MQTDNSSPLSFAVIVRILKRKLTIPSGLNQFFLWLKEFLTRHCAGVTYFTWRPKLAFEYFEHLSSHSALLMLFTLCLCCIGYATKCFAPDESLSSKRARAGHGDTLSVPFEITTTNVYIFTYLSQGNYSCTRHRLRRRQRRIYAHAIDLVVGNASNSKRFYNIFVSSKAAPETLS